MNTTCSPTLLKSFWDIGGRGQRLEVAGGRFLFNFFFTYRVRLKRKGLRVTHWPGFWRWERNRVSVHTPHREPESFLLSHTLCQDTIRISFCLSNIGSNLDLNSSVIVTNHVCRRRPDEDGVLDVVLGGKETERSDAGFENILGDTEREL